MALTTDKGQGLESDLFISENNNNLTNSFDISCFDGYDEPTKAKAIQICSLLEGMGKMDTIKLLGKIQLSILGKRNIKSN